MKKTSTIRILSLFLCLTLVLALTSCQSGPQEEEIPEESTTKSIQEVIDTAVLQYPSKNENFRYIIYDTYIAITEYLGAGGDVVIPNTIENLPVYVIKSNAFREYSTGELSSGKGYVQDGRITSVKISEGISIIESEAFINCESLVKIELPSSLRTIGFRAFQGCIALTNLRIPYGVNVIGDAAFAFTKSLREIIIPESVTSIGKQCFQGSGLVSIVIPSSILTIPEGFCSRCDNLVNVKIIEAIIEENVENTGGEVQGRVIHGEAFAYCPNLTNVWIPGNFLEISNSAFNYSVNKLWLCSYMQSTAASYASRLLLDFKLVTEDDFAKLYKESAQLRLDEIDKENKNQESTTVSNP